MRLTLILIVGIGLIVAAAFGLREETHCHRYAEGIRRCHDPDTVGRRLLLYGHSPFDYQQICSRLEDAEDWPTTPFRKAAACLAASGGDCELAFRCLNREVLLSGLAGHERVEPEEGSP